MAFRTRPHPAGSGRAEAPFEQKDGPAVSEPPAVSGEGGLRLTTPARQCRLLRPSFPVFGNDPKYRGTCERPNPGQLCGECWLWQRVRLYIAPFRLRVRNATRCGNRAHLRLCTSTPWPVGG